MTSSSIALAISVAVSQRRSAVMSPDLRRLAAGSANDVWVVGDDNCQSTDLTTPMVWHFGGVTWVRQPNPQPLSSCVAADGISITAALATPDGVYVAGNCTNGSFQSVALVERFWKYRWRVVMRGGPDTAVYGSVILIRELSGF